MLRPLEDSGQLQSVASAVDLGDFECWPQLLVEEENAPVCNTKPQIKTKNHNQTYPKLVIPMFTSSTKTASSIERIIECSNNDQT